MRPASCRPCRRSTRSSARSTPTGRGRWCEPAVRCRRRRSGLGWRRRQRLLLQPHRGRAAVVAIVETVAAAYPENVYDIVDVEKEIAVVVGGEFGDEPRPQRWPTFVPFLVRDLHLVRQLGNGVESSEPRRIYGDAGVVGLVLISS